MTRFFRTCLPGEDPYDTAPPRQLTRRISNICIDDLDRDLSGLCSILNVLGTYYLAGGLRLGIFWRVPYRRNQPLSYGPPT